MIDATVFGVSRTSIDNTSAFNKAVRAASLDNLGHTVQLPPGTLRFQSRPEPIGVGVVVRGDGAVGASRTGTVLMADYNDTDDERGFLTWDGNEGIHGTGGGLECVSIQHSSNTKGGVGVKLTGEDVGHRVGWFRMRDVYIYANWLHGILVDGMKCIKKGSQGIRDLTFDNVKVTTCIEPKEYVVLRNVVEFCWTGGLITPGSGVPAGVVISGGPNLDNLPIPSYQKSTYVNFTGVNILGTLLLDHIYQFTLACRFGSDVTITENAERGLLTGIYLGRVENKGVRVDILP